MAFAAPTDNEAIRDISHQMKILNETLEKLNETIVNLNKENQSLQKRVVLLSVIGTFLIIVQVALTFVPL
jgi:predicted  nucleic acid-binding Zn-ribbon protein